MSSTLQLVVEPVGKFTCKEDEIVTLFSGSKPSISQNGDESWTATFDTEQTMRSAIEYMNLEDIKSSFVGCITVRDGDKVVFQ